MQDPVSQDLFKAHAEQDKENFNTQSRMLERLIDVQETEIREVRAIAVKLEERQTAAEIKMAGLETKLNAIVDGNRAKVAALWSVAVGVALCFVTLLITYYFKR